MRKIITVGFLFFFLSTNSASSQPQEQISVSLGKVRVSFSLDKTGVPFYEMLFNQQLVIRPSKMGFMLKDITSSDKAFEVIKTDTLNFDKVWQPVWGEVKNIRNHYKQLTIYLKQKSSPGLQLNIVFRVFEDGIGFRYEFPGQPNLKYFIVSDELTEFALTGDHKTFWIPGDYDTNEYPYTTSKLSEIDNTDMVNKSTAIAVRVAPDKYAVQTPLMMKTADGLYINIHEAALVDYPAMQLHVNTGTYSLTSSLVPDAIGNKAYLRAPAKTPWRTIIVSNKATDILASKIILNLNEPSVIKNTSWIKPMKFMGVWWEMQIGKSGWNYANNIDSLSSKGGIISNGHHGANTANVKHYIDFASSNGIEGLLVEGWNTGWEEWFGLWKENVFDFVTPYPDFDVAEITSYARTKGVKMIMHNETSGSATNYERYMDTAFRFMNKYGYTSVKTGYVGKIIPRGEHHDGQWMIQHYVRAAQKAADYRVMIDMHEPVRPTGLQRTYPNWLACEAGRGNEFNAFSEGNLPEHETIMPFTRLIGGPMDYTPGIFKLKGYNTSAPQRQVHTTLAKQLALYVTMYSPLQMAADLPENYQAHMDAFQFIKDVAVDWDDTKIIAAEPGDYVTIARKAKDSGNWFIGAVTDENSRNAVIPLNFLDKGKKYNITIYEDAKDADWKNNPEAYSIQHMVVSASTILNIRLASGGGAGIVIKPQ
ncbi:MAG: glycoside hydrolase family 97 protein [Ginsengibacter sp.]